MGRGGLRRKVRGESGLRFHCSGSNETQTEKGGGGGGGGWEGVYFTRNGRVLFSLPRTLSGALVSLVGFVKTPNSGLRGGRSERRRMGGVQYCFTSTETLRTVKGAGSVCVLGRGRAWGGGGEPQDSHLDFHTSPEL